MAYLMDFAKLNKKRIVVFLENTDDLLTKSLKTSQEIKIFRNLLLHETFILFITTSPTFAEASRLHAKRYLFIISATKSS